MLSRNVVIIDDIPVLTNDCLIALGNLGHNVNCVQTSTEALSLIRKEQVDLVVINSVIADVDGVEIFTLMRAVEPNIIGILLIENSDVRPVINAVNAGFSGILEKPIQSVKLVNAVQDALAIARSREEYTRLKTLFPLYQLGEKFISATSLEQVYEELVSIICREIQVPCVSVMMFDKDSTTLRIVASKGLSVESTATVRIKPGENISGWVFTHGKPIILNKKTQHETPLSPFLQREDIAASISYPIIIRGEVSGVVNISDSDMRVEYSEADIEMLSVICSQAVLAIENVLALQQREQALRLRTMFEQYVSPEVAELLLSQKENMLDIGEVKRLTILFADIRNFTGLVQHISPDQIRVFLNEFFELFANIVFNASGTLDKFMGDAALVLFGAPVTVDKPCLAAVESALKILDGFEELRSRWLKKSSRFSNVGIGIGISCGEVYLGNVGSERRLDFTVIGTDVNIAQRLASETDAGQILITESVNNAVTGNFTISEGGSRSLRGLDHEINVYTVRPVKLA